MNYTLQEYANDVVYHIQTVCDEAGVPHPTIISESGRAIVGVPQRAGLQRAGRLRVRRGEDSRRGRRDECRAAAGRPASRPTTDVTPRNAARELPRRAAGARHGDEPVQRRLPVARAARARREPVLGHLRRRSASSSQGWTTCPRTCRRSTNCCPTPTSATSRCSSRCPTAGRSSSCSR